MKYTEENEVTRIYKSNYLDELENLIRKRQKEAEKQRSEYAKNIFENPQKYRDDLKNMLGWPLSGHFDNNRPEAKSEFLSSEDGYDIYRIRFEILDGINMTGLFFRQHGDDEKPLVIVQHGGGGTPELISGIYGDTFNYNDMLQRVRSYGVHVFAPQLLLWEEKYGAEFDRKDIDARLKRVGSSITAVEVFGIMRIIDYFEHEKYVSTFGMVGLSYGGFYTLYTAAADVRIKSALSCAFFNTRDAVGWSDWVWSGSAYRFDDAEVACLIYPRKLYIEIGDKDELFNYKHGIESFTRLKSMCGKCGAEWVNLNVFDGIHEFEHDDDSIHKLISDLKQ